MNIYDDPVTDQVVTRTLVETGKVKIRHMSAQKQKFAAKKLGLEAENNVVVVLRGQLGGKDKTKLKAGDFTIFQDGADVVGADEESSWLSVSFNGKVGKGLFPSPDELALKRLKQSIKRNVFAMRIDSLFESKDVRVERIAAKARTESIAMCENEIFHQFVLVMDGEAVLEVEHELAPVAASGSGGQTGALVFDTQKVSLGRGDYYTIPANTRARVVSTKADDSTVMLSIYFGGELKYS